MSRFYSLICAITKNHIKSGYIIGFHIPDPMDLTSKVSQT